MTRLNSTFRPCCKIKNRKTTKGDSNAIQVRYARKDIRVGSIRDKIALGLYKDKIRAEELLQSALHARQKVRKTGRDCRVLDVAGDISMDEDLQVRLLSTNETSDVVLEPDGSICEPFHDTTLLALKNTQKFETLSEISQSQGLKNACKRSKRNHSKLRNGDSRIEAIITINGRCNEQSRIPESETRPKDEADLNRLGLLESSSNINLSAADASLDRRPQVLEIENGVSSLNSPPANNSAYLYKDDMKQLTKIAGPQMISHCCVEEKVKNSSSIDNGGILHEFVLENLSDSKSSLILEHLSHQSHNSTNEKLLDSLTCNAKFEKGITEMDKKLNGKCNFVNDCSCSNLNNSLLNNTSSNGKEKHLSNLKDGENHKMEKGFPKKCSNDKEEQIREQKTQNVNRRRNNKNKAEKDSASNSKRRRNNSRIKTSEVQRNHCKSILRGNITEIIDNSRKAEEVCYSETEILKMNDQIEEDDVQQVLGIKISQDGICKVLVQFKDGTSNWIEKVQLEPFREKILEYFTYPCQDLAVIHRPSFSVYDESLSTITSASSAVKCKGKEKFPIEIKSDCPEFFPNTCTVDKCDKEEEITHLSTAKDKISASPLQSNKELCPEECHSLELESNTAFENEDLLAITDDTNMNGIEPLGYKSWDHLSRTNVIVDGNATIKNEINSLNVSDKLKSDKMYISKNGELEVIESEFTQIVLRHKDRRSKRICVDTCDNLIQQLELRSTDKTSSFVVIYGLEEYFASTMDMEKILKVPAHTESTRHDEKITSLRYLFQTLKNYPKPIVAVVNSAATGLAAAVLSLVDVVYDETIEFGAENNGLVSHHIKLPVLVPKLMGVLPKNEALLMGDISDATRLEEQLQKVGNLYSGYKFSHGLKETLKEMKKNEWLSINKPIVKKRGRPATPKRSTVSSKRTSVGEDAKKLSTVQPPSNNGEKVDEIKEELEEEIEREKEMSLKCLVEIADFWKEISQVMINE